MTTLRESIASLPRFQPGAVNLGEVAGFLHHERPVSVRGLMVAIAALPDSVPFHAQIVTGAALGGELTVTLHNDGSYRSTGFMRATGIPSFDYRLVAMVRSASGQMMVADQRSGEVFGSDTPGPRQDDWDETVNVGEQVKVIRNAWPDLSAGSLQVGRSSSLRGTLGAAGDVLEAAATFFVAAQTLGVSLAVCVTIGSELNRAGADVPSLGGIVGLGIVGGSLFVWGPYAIGPAIIAGVAAGAVVEAMVKTRKLTAAEMAFADQVFASSIDYDHVRLTNMVGFGDRPFTMPTVDGTVLVNLGDGDVYDDPANATLGDKYAVPGQLLIHELVHVWQVQHASAQDGFVPGVMCELIVAQAGGDAAYRYGPAGPPWSSFNGEAKAAIVDQWFAGVGRQKPNAMDQNGPYFGYIVNNLRLGNP